MCDTAAEIFMFKKYQINNSVRNVPIYVNVQDSVTDAY